MELRRFALTLNFYSRKAYNYVRMKLNKILPHTSTLSKWYSTIDGSPGFLKEALEALKNKVCEAKEKGNEVLCNFVLDEMAIMKRIEWDGKRTYGYVDLGINVEGDSGDNLEEAKEALVFMLVALNSCWKIPVAYFLTNGLSGNEKANLLEQCLEYIHSAGVIVTSITFDGAPSNISMCNVLGANLNYGKDFKTYFLHPVTKQPVYIFFDACHMVKLIRNCFGSFKILTDKSGHQIEWNYLEKLGKLQEDSGLHAATKLRKKHLEWVNEKMKVSLAVQTLSKSVAEALDFLNKDLNMTDFQGSEATAYFCRLINNLFDVFNSRNRMTKKPYDKPLSLATEAEYFNFLDDCVEYIKSLKLGDTKVIFSRRKVGFLGFIISISSLKGLYETRVKQRKELKYLLTYKLSQDHLEIFFSCVRSKGGFSNNPTSKQFQNILKKLLIHSEIRGSESSNAIALDSTSILHCSSSPLEIKMNADTAQDSTVDENDEDYMEFQNYLATSPWQLTLYLEDVVAYVAGFVVKRLRKDTKCLSCLNLLETAAAPLSKLQMRKEYGKLTKASPYVINICKYAENCFRLYKDNLKIDFKNISKILQILINYTLQNLPAGFGNVFEDHIFEDEPLSNHFILLSKKILEKYFILRLHHYTSNLKEAPKRIRSLLTKTILFKNQ